MNKTWHRLLALMAASFVPLPSAFACSACYGEPDSPMSNGLTWAILVLVVLVGVVLAGVTAFFVYMNRRARLLGKSEATPLHS